MKAFLTILKGISFILLCFFSLTQKKSLSTISTIQIKITPISSLIYEIRSSVPLTDFCISSNSLEILPNYKIEKKENGRRILLSFEEYPYGWYGETIFTCFYENIRHSQYFFLALKNTQPVQLFINSFGLNNKLSSFSYLSIKIFHSGSSNGLNLCLFSKKGLLQKISLPKVYMKKDTTWRLYFSNLENPIILEKTKEIYLPLIKFRPTFVISLIWEEDRHNEDFIIFSQNKSISIKTIEKLLSNIHVSYKKIQNPIVIVKKHKTKQEFTRKNKKEPFI